MRSFLKPVITLAFVTAGLCLAQAQPVGYAKAPVTIKCGVLLLPNPSGGEPTNADPYVFFNLEKRTDVKPASWVFVNPHGGSTFTRRQAGRWNTLTGTTNFSAGTRLNKNMAAYWEVELSQVANVADYDVLMVHAPGGISLNTAERDKLQAFIDAGGTLWFDKSFTQSVDGFNGFPVPFTTVATGANPQVVQPFHPILNYPFSLGYFDAAYMGSHNGGHAIVRQTLASIGLGGFGDIVQTMEPDFYRLNPIIANTSGISLGVAELGNGHFVVSSGNISSRINEPAGGTDIGLGRNSGPVAGTNFGAIPMTELKFVYNMIALSGGHPALSKGSRRHNASFDEIGAPLLQTWSDPT
ncbi:MAG: hypothetical protein H0W86_08750, partial [Armatimonadetes bacterium]|nr:hypothetical protein [Armatimonadota bacterium]